MKPFRSNYTVSQMMWHDMLVLAVLLRSNWSFMWRAMYFLLSLVLVFAEVGNGWHFVFLLNMAFSVYVCRGLLKDCMRR